MKNPLVHLLFFLFLFLNIGLSAQSEFTSLILSSSDSSKFYISKGRAELLQNIQQCEGERNIEYLHNNFEFVDLNEYVFLFIDEEQIISFLTGNKEIFFKSLEEKDWILDRILPEIDNLFDSCHAVLEANINYWKNYIEELELTEEEEIIYSLFLSQMGFDLEKSMALSLSKKYQKKYKNDLYIPYVKSLKTDFTTGSIGYAFGIGNMYLGGSASSYVEASGILSFEMDYFVNRFYFSTYLDVNIKGASLLELDGYDENDYFQIYEQGNRATHFSIGAKVGALVYKNNFLKLYPYGIVSLANLSVSHSIYEVDNLSLSTGVGLGVGLGLDIPLFSWKGSDFENEFIIDHHLGLRFNAGGESILAFKYYTNYSYLFMHAGIVWWMGD